MGGRGTEPTDHLFSQASRRIRGRDGSTCKFTASPLHPAFSRREIESVFLICGKGDIPSSGRPTHLPKRSSVSRTRRFNKSGHRKSAPESGGTIGRANPTTARVPQGSVSTTFGRLLSSTEDVTRREKGLRGEINKTVRLRRKMRHVEKLDSSLFTFAERSGLLGVTTEEVIQKNLFCTEDPMRQIRRRPREPDCGFQQDF